MYPVNIGYSGALSRIKALTANGHHAEALVTTTFTVEKTLRRTLRQLVISAGFPSAMAEKIVGSLRGLDAIKNAWELYDPRNRRLTDLLSPADWKTFSDAAQMRNNLVHGVRVYDLDVCDNQAQATLSSLENVKTRLDSEYGYSGWSRAKSRLTPRLHVDSKVTWTK